MEIPFKLSDGQIKGYVVDGTQYVCHSDLIAWFYKNADENKELKEVFLHLARAMSTMSTTPRNNQV